MRPAVLRVAVAVILAASWPVPARAQSDARQRELETLRQRIEDTRQRVARYEREQRGLLETLEELDRTAAALSAAARRARREAREAQAELRRTEARIAELEEQLARTRRAMAERAVALYRTGEVGPVALVFAAGDLRELLGRVEGLQRLLRYDQRLIARFQEEQAALEAARAQAREAAARESAALERVEARMAELRAERRQRRELLARVRGDRSRERAALVELEAAARALEETLARLPESAPSQPAPGAGAFAALQGRLAPPVDAPVVRGFGRVVDAEFHTQVFRKGVDFGAPPGTPVRAVADGVVRFAGWFRGYGRIVIVDHGDRYFTVSGHLDELAVEVGDRVAAGDTLGTVGETGSLSGPRLYFEIRRGAEPLDPAGWLALGGSG